jgi:hypothetical protein
MIIPQWISDLGGIIQRQDMDKIPDNSSPLLLNISLVKPGTWMKRKGTDLLGTTLAGSGTRGALDYLKPDTTHEIHAVRTTNLDKYVSATDTYSTIDAADFASTGQVQSVNYLGRTYWIGANEPLRYSSGGTTTAVVDTAGTPQTIQGNTIATAQNTLFIGGINKIGSGAVSYRDRVYYSRFDEDTGLGTHNYYDDAHAWEWQLTTRFFSTVTPVRALYTFSTLGTVIAFSESEAYQFNIRYEDQLAGVDRLFGIGCVGPRAVTECNGWLTWMAPDKRIMGWTGGSTPPQPLTWAIEDDANGEAIINKILASNLSTVCAGSLGNTIYYSIGTITQFGETITNALLVGLFSQDSSSILWSLYSLPFKPTIFFNANFDGERVLCFGNETNDNIYRMEIGTSDNGTAITAKARTKFYHFSMPYQTKETQNIFVKFRPQAVNNTYLKVSAAYDGKVSYAALSDPDAVTPVTTHGVIDMYQSDYATNLDKVGIIEHDAAKQYRSVSWEFSNNILDESFVISSFGQDVTELALLDQTTVIE